MAKEENQDVKLWIELEHLKRETDEIKHKMKMEELNFERESARIFHEKTLERGRITRAENRKLALEKRSIWGK